MTNNAEWDATGTEGISVLDTNHEHSVVAAGRPERAASFSGQSDGSGHEESLVVEERAHLRPAQVVESKLNRLLQEASLPVSHLQMRGLLKLR
jgi:hypothetical protein